MESRRNVRWIKTSVLSEEAFRDLQEQLRKVHYTEESGLGFIFNKLAKHHIEATYIERKLRRSEIAGPFGKVQQLEWLEFTAYAFTFDRRRRLVEIDGSARSLAPLIRQFGVLTGWNSSFEPLALEPTRFLDFLREERVRFDITRLQVDEVTLSANSSVSLDVTGRGSVLKDLDKLLGTRKCTLTGLAVVVSEPSKTLRIELSNTGRISTDGVTCDDAIALCRKAIIWSQSM